MHRRAAWLKTGVKHPGTAELIEPGAVGNERRLMHMARDHHRRLVALDPLHEFLVAEKALAAPTGRGIRRRSVMDPNPSLQPPGGSLAKLVVDALLDQRSIPPGTHREKGVADRQAVAVAGDAEFANVADPAGDLLAFRIAFVEVMISRAKNHPGEAGEKRQIFLHDDNLGAEIDRGSDVEGVARKDHKIELRRRAQQPVKLRQRIMQIGYDKAAHINSIRMLKN